MSTEETAVTKRRCYEAEAAAPGSAVRSAAWDEQRESLARGGTLLDAFAPDSLVGALARVQRGSGDVSASLALGTLWAGSRLLSSYARASAWNASFGSQCQLGIGRSKRAQIGLTMP